MNIRYYPLLVAAVLALMVLLLATAPGCYGEMAYDDQRDVAATTSVMVVPCDQHNGGELWATASYPGFTVEDMAHIHAFGQITPDGNAITIERIYLGPEQASVMCSGEPMAPFKQVTFVLR